MSILQTQFSWPRLMAVAMTRKRSPVTLFSPFSIRVNGLYCQNKQINAFNQMFGPVDAIPSFAFIVAFPVLKQCLIQSSIPSRLMGLLHISTEFITHQKPNWLLPSDIEVVIQKIEQSPKGLLYTMETRIFQKGQLTVTNTNTMLDKARDHKSPKLLRENKNELEYGNALSSSTITTRNAVSYAKLSGDFNPIHLHPWLAKRFGLPNALIHGMFNVHYLLSWLEKHTGITQSRICVEFNRPCYLPNRVYIRRIGDQTEYGLFSKDNSERYLKMTVEE